MNNAALKNIELINAASKKLKINSVRVKELYKLTSRELIIINMLLDGVSPKEIAFKLGIKHRTVDFHRNNIYRKLGIQSIQELFAKYNDASLKDSLRGADIAGNKYKLTITDRVKFAYPGDHYELEIDSAEEGVKRINGIITNVIDNTLFLSNPGGQEVAVTINDEIISSIVGTIILSNGQPFIVRTFDQIFLRCVKWSDSDRRGETYSSGDCIMLTDFYSGNIKDLFTGEIFNVRLTGNINNKLNRTAVTINHVSSLGVRTNIGYTKTPEETKEINSGDFDVIIKISMNRDCNLSEFDFRKGEIFIQLEDALYFYNKNNNDWNYGKPTHSKADINRIYASVTNFQIIPVI